MNVIGLDLGTTTLSAILLDGETGEVRRVLNVPNGADIPSPDPWARMQDADRIAERALGLVDTLTAESGPAAAIGIDGQMHGMLYLNRAGEAVSPLFTWQDGRGDQPFEGGTYVSALAERTGCAVATGFGMVTHFWHTMRGAIPAGAVRLCTIFDYVGMKLTGRTSPLTHISGAASMGLFDRSANFWSRSALERAGIDPAMLPQVTAGCGLLGETPQGTPVSVAIGDNQASFLGSVREMEGTVLVNMGTGGQASMLANTAAAPADLALRPLTDGLDILAGSSLCGGRAYAMLEKFLRSCAALAGCECEPLYAAMNEAGLAALDLPDLPLVDTRFSGTRTRPDLRGSVSGLDTVNFDAAHLIGGTLMGMARELFDFYRQMQPARRMVGSGNAIRRNPALKAAFERTFGMEMLIPAHTEEAAFGAALFGMTAAGLCPSIKDAQKLIRYL